MIILLCGVSGAGKTWLRKRAFPSFPHVDIKDSYKRLGDTMGVVEPWYAATIDVARRAKQAAREHGDVVVEGYFLPGTKSRSVLREQLAGYEIQSVFLHAEHDVCTRRVIESGKDVDRRLEFLNRCWPRAEAAM
jgi:hypothetical protein